MQITIDTNNDSNAQLTHLAQFLLALSGQSVAIERTTTTHAVGNVSKTVTVESPKHATGASDAPPPPPPLADTIATDAAGTSSTESSNSASSQSGAHDTADLDAQGLPHDSRIHSSSKNKVQDGSWRKLRGVDDALVATVEAELRALMGNAATGAEDAGSTSTDSPASAAAADAPPPPPPLADAPPPPPVVEGVTAADVFKHVTALQKAEGGSKLPQELLTEALSMVGLTSMGDFMKNKDKAADLLEAINLIVGE